MVRRQHNHMSPDGSCIAYCRNSFATERVRASVMPIGVARGAKGAMSTPTPQK